MQENPLTGGEIHIYKYTSNINYCAPLSIVVESHRAGPPDELELGSWQSLIRHVRQHYRASVHLSKHIADFSILAELDKGLNSLKWSQISVIKELNIDTNLTWRSFFN
jgi:hypothetical protein